MGLEEPLLGDLLGRLWVAPKAQYRNFGARELLRSLELLAENFDPEKSGWKFFQNFNYLRAVHAVVCSIQIDDPQLDHCAGDAIQKMQKDRIGGPEPVFESALSILELIKPNQAYDGRFNSRSPDILLCQRLNEEYTHVKLCQGAAVYDMAFLDNLPISMGLFGYDGQHDQINFIRVLETQPELRFWLEWYKKFVDGTSPDSQLDSRVALIQSVDWAKGAVHIASVIEEIQARLEVGRTADEVQRLLASPDLIPPGMGHNNPPEVIGDLPIGTIELSEAKQAVDEVKRELSQPNPSKTVIGIATAKIKGILRTSLKWFAKKADIATDEFAKKFGGYCAAAALPVLTWALGQLPNVLDALSSLAKSLEAWLILIP